MTEPTPLNLPPLAPYEDRLLSALAFFRSQRDRTNQAHHCLSMYLRQSESRVMSEVGFYARRLGMSADDLMELIYTQPEVADLKIQEVLGTKPSAVFKSDSY
jgi:hypothetical protein